MNQVTNHTTNQASNQATHPTANQSWGGRFAAGPAAIMEQINASIGFDYRLARVDIMASRVHCRMLMAQNIIPKSDGEKILTGLDQIATEIAQGQFQFKIAHEDIHMNIEARLHELIGQAAGRLHTARSRNDQVATDFRLWIRRETDDIQNSIRALQSALIAQAELHYDKILPGLTHFQAAQPVTFGHYLLAYVEMLGRDRGRFADARARLNQCPLGSAALAGTPYDIDRDFVSRELGFDAPTENSLDAVSDRDFVVEFLAASSLLSVHLSRLAEEIILWVSDQFRFVSLSDRFTTGSSIMPQKRNPDAAELLRGKTGRVVGDLVAMLMTLKALPLAYSKDLQEDKEPIFDAVETLQLGLAAMTGMIEDMRVNAAAMRQAAERGFITATDLADYLVMALHVPFREAHGMTGRLVALAEAKSIGLAELTLNDMQQICPAITQEIYQFLTVDGSVARRKCYGGTAPEQVLSAIARAKARYL
ncbi:MAG: argininosuccinate lyase [Alphaproteobacteria bacterium]|nr:argininosuccinate lyase [Alphaproteobacteria bacterium]